MCQTGLAGQIQALLFDIFLVKFSSQFGLKAKMLMFS